jgi:hypothetical protein
MGQSRCDIEVFTVLSGRLRDLVQGHAPRLTAPSLEVCQRNFRKNDNPHHGMNTVFAAENLQTLALAFHSFADLTRWSYGPKIYKKMQISSPPPLPAAMFPFNLQHKKGA